MTKPFEIREFVPDTLLEEALAKTREKEAVSSRPLGLVMAAWQLYQDRLSDGTDEEQRVAAVLYGLSWVKTEAAETALSELVNALNEAKLLVYNPYFYDLKLFTDSLNKK